MTTHCFRSIVLLLGPPGAGKGTQARFLRDTLSIPHVASGDLLREHRRRGTPVGLAAQAYMDRGDLVPDELVIAMIVDRLERDDAKRGALLDGFPRNQAQAEVLDRVLAERKSVVRAALYFDVASEALVERIAGRWLCPACQATYPSTSTKPPGNGRCVDCGDLLYQRPDDRPEVVQTRIEVYLRETLPIIEHYDQRGVLVRVDGNRSIEAVRVTLCSSLGGVLHGRRREHWHVYISQHLRADDRPEWSGRTLCGQHVDYRSGRRRGTVANFNEQPCRQCLLELRPRQRPIVQLPAPASRDDERREMT